MRGPEECLGGLGSRRERAELPYLEVGGKGADAFERTGKGERGGTDV